MKRGEDVFLTSATEANMLIVYNKDTEFATKRPDDPSFICDADLIASHLDKAALNAMACFMCGALADDSTL